MQSHAFTIGTRGSPLALAQAHQVRDAICDVHGLESDAVEIRTISTTGDRIADKALREFGGKGLFTKEIEEALLSGEIDAAVHSMKDMPTELPPGLEIACFLPREDVRDAFISSKAADLSGLKKGAVLGTASLRRQAQIKRARPDLEVVTFRGNVQTRLRKLADDEADATLLANAGLRRLGLESHIAALMEPEVMLPAVAQGAIGIEIRTGDEQTANLLKPLNHEPTQACIAAERAFLARLDGSCRTPIAGLAELDGNQMRFRGQILRPDGSESHETSREGDARNGEAMARDAAEELLGRAGEGFFEDPD